MSASTRSYSSCWPARRTSLGAASTVLNTRKVMSKSTVHEAWKVRGDSAVWEIVEAPGIWVGRVSLDKAAGGWRAYRNPLIIEKLQLDICKALSGQEFKTRQDALQAVEAMMRVQAEERNLDDWPPKA